MSELKVGIIGCGYICDLHVANINRCDRMQVIAAGDIDADAAERVRQKCHAGYATCDIARIINDKNIDALLIFASQKAHTQLIEKACLAGKHFFIEKPLALSIKDCMQIQRWVKQAKVKNQVGYWLRHCPLTVKVARVIPSPDFVIGRCVHGLTKRTKNSMTFRTGDVYEKGGYFGHAGYLFDTAIRLIPSPPVSVHAVSASENLSNTISSHVKFKNGAAATLIHCDMGPAAMLPKWFFEIFAEDINATISDWTELRFSPCTELNVTGNDYFNGFNEQMENFADYVLGDSDSPMNILQATLPTVLMEKSIISIEQNKPQEIDWEKYRI